MFEYDGLPSMVVARVTGATKRKQGQIYNYVTHKAEYSYGGVNYRINSSKSGCVTAYLQKTIEQIYGMVELYKRVLYLRVDLHHSSQEDASKRVSQFIKSLKAHAMRNYDSKLGYLWAREQEKAKSQHYHLVLMLDGDKVRHPHKWLDTIKDIWVRAGGYVVIPQNSYIFIKDDKDVHNAIYRSSYLTKSRGKGYRPNGCRDFEGSRIPFSNSCAGEK